MGTALINSLLMKFDYDPLIYEYFKLLNLGSVNVTEVLSYQERRVEICHEIMKRDVAVVKVRMGSNKYSKYSKDIRMTFADKLASFGKYTLDISPVYLVQDLESLHLILSL